MGESVVQANGRPDAGLPRVSDSLHHGCAHKQAGTPHLSLAPLRHGLTSLLTPPSSLLSTLVFVLMGEAARESHHAHTDDRRPSATTLPVHRPPPLPQAHAAAMLQPPRQETAVPGRQVEQEQLHEHAVRVGIGWPAPPVPAVAVPAQNLSAHTRPRCGSLLHQRSRHETSRWC